MQKKEKLFQALFALICAVSIIALVLGCIGSGLYINEKQKVDHYEKTICTVTQSSLGIRNMFFLYSQDSHLCTESDCEIVEEAEEEKEPIEEEGIEKRRVECTAGFTECYTPLWDVLYLLADGESL